VEKRLLVVAEAMEEIKNWKVARFVRVKAGRQENTIRNRAAKDFAWDGVALGPAGCKKRRRKEAKEKEKKEDPSLRSG